MKETMIQRIKDLENAIVQSAANHNALLGSLHEAKYMLEMIAPSTTPILEGAEAVVQAVACAIAEPHAA